MQIGKLNITEWRWNGRKLWHPLLIIWKLIWLIPVYCALFIFAVIMGIFDLKIKSFMDIMLK